MRPQKTYDKGDTTNPRRAGPAPAGWGRAPDPGNATHATPEVGDHRDPRRVLLLFPVDPTRAESAHAHRPRGQFSYRTKSCTTQERHSMTHAKLGRHFRPAAPGLAIVATVALAVTFLAPAISPASAATTTTTTTTPTTTTTAVPGSNCSASAGGTVLDRGGWSATSNAPYSSDDAPARALDGNFSTRFSTNEDQTPGLALRVDLGAARVFDQLAMRPPIHPRITPGASRCWYQPTTARGPPSPPARARPTPR